MKTVRAFLLLLAVVCFLPTGAAAQAVPPEALVLSPEPGERVAPGDVFVAVSFIDPAAQLDPASVAVRIGGVDVTAETELQGGVLTWRPRQPLASGPHRVVVTALDRSGRAIEPAAWTFNVTAAAAAPVVAGAAPPLSPQDIPGSRLRGSLVLEGSSQSISGAGAPFRRGEEFLPLMWLNAGGVLGGGWRYAARVHLSGYESSDLQPVNRYRFDLRGPFVNLSAGDVTPVFHDLILAGRRVRGFQGELWAGPARIAVVTGQSRRAIPGLLSTDPTIVARPGTFGQDLFAIRPSIGTGRRFQLGLTALRVRDDVTSLGPLRTSPTEGGDSRSVNPAPKDNLVAGLDLTLRLAGGRLLLQYDNAVSLFANDISGGPLTEAQLDSLLTTAGYEAIGLDPSSFERFFILNSSLLPLDPRGGGNVAQQLRASVRAGTHLLVGEWSSVGGSYYTLGYQALQRDRAGIRIRDTFSALDGSLVMSLGLERDNDNLEDVKAATTTSTALFATANWQAAPNGLGLYGSMRVGTRSNDLPAGRDGARDEQHTSLSGGASIPLGMVSALRTRLSLNASLVSRDDPRNPTFGSSDVYLLGGLHGETESQGSAGALLLGVNRWELTGYVNATTDVFRAAANGRHRFAPQWTGTLDASYTMARSPDGTELGLDYDRLELLGGGEFEWMTATVVGLTAGVVSYTDNLFAGRDTRELIVRLRVSRYF